MKALLVSVALLALVGCTDNRPGAKGEERFEPKFSFDEKVTFKHGFLKGQTGTVTAAMPCFADKQGTYASDKMCYRVVIITENHGPMVWDNVPERELVD